MDNSLQLTDATIAHISHLLQLAILTGTDVMDHFRLMRLVTTDSGKIMLDPLYEENFKLQLDKMTKFAEDTLEARLAELTDEANQNREPLE
jgi:hypothetical protein